MSQFSTPFIRFLFVIAKSILMPFPGLRTTFIKGLVLMEENKAPIHDHRKSLIRLLDTHGFIEATIDRQCVHWGSGVHVKHRIMDGIHSFFSDRVLEGSRVLDVGCGIGALAYDIAVNSQAMVIGMDTNVAHIQFALDHFQHPRLRFVLGDVTTDLPSEKIDVLILSSLLEHLDDRIGFLRKLQTNYKPGKFLIRVPTFERHYFAALKRHLHLFAFTDLDHRLEYTLESFIFEMHAAGLKILHYEIRWGDIWAECGFDDTQSVRSL